MRNSYGEEYLEEEILILKEGHGSENHAHSKAGESFEISSKIASGSHIRPDALLSSHSTSLSVSEISIVAIFLASFYTLMML